MPQFVSDAYYRQLCEHLGMALIATDGDLNIVAWNAVAARTFGAAADQMIGTPIVHVIPQERRATAQRMLRRAMETGEYIRLEFEHRDDHGARRELAGTIAPVVNDDGLRIGASICIRDITRRIELQGELHESRKMAALGEMAGAISHHFNNILGGAVTSIDFARVAGDDSPQSRVLDQVATALQRASDLVTGLLAFAEGDRRSDDLCDMTELVILVAEATERQVEALNISFVLTMASLPVLPVPRFAVQTAITKIIQNAIEAMPDGGRLALSLSMKDDVFVIEIEDSGCGVDALAKSRMFEPFWSTKSMGTTDGATGVGLGLAIAHGLVKMIGGAISVTSEAGKGSRFKVTLPRPDPLT